MSVWRTLKKPIFALAPMENVTDTVFRQIVVSCGKPDVFFTEFTNCEGILSQGFEEVRERLEFTEIEHPIIAQVWGNNPDSFYKTAQVISKMGFDGIDINMGCPDRTIMKKGACGALIKNYTLASEIISATREGADSLPLSVKTRIGFTQIATEEWVKFLLEQNLDAIILHLRTVKEESKVPAHWQEAGKAVRLRDALKKDTVILGNGDIKSLADAQEKVKRYGVDGVMIGRGIFDNMWLFNKTRDATSTAQEEKLRLLLAHVRLFRETWGENKNFATMKKFVKAYINGFPKASDMRVLCMETNSLEELEYEVSKMLSSGSYQFV